MVYLDNYIKPLLNSMLKNFIKQKSLDSLRRCDQNPQNCEGVDIFISAGSKEHWQDSLEFALSNGGFMIWGRRVEDKEKWVQEIITGGIKGMEKSLLTSYLKSSEKLGKSAEFSLSPITINVFYCNDVGLIGAGIVTTIIIDSVNPFWAEERRETSSRGVPVVIFPFRWLAKILWLHSSVRAYPTNPDMWRGIEPPEGIITRGGLQPVKDLQLKSALVKALIEEIEKGIDKTLELFERHAEVKEMKPEVVQQPIPVEKYVLDVSPDELTKVREAVLQEFAVEPDIVDFLLSVLVYGCKNVLLIGRPGTGKTGIARFVAEMLSFEPVVVTANAHWSRVDVIGGPMFIGTGSVTWKPGILMQAIARHIEAKKRGKRGAWLIIDEINRTDVDKAFGEFFTIFSGPEPSEWVVPSYIVDEWSRYSSMSKDDVYRVMLEEIRTSLRKSDIGYYVPPDFRVIGTMNYVDVSNLFAIGEAFTRRFARIIIDYPSDIGKELDILLNKIRRRGEFADVVKVIDGELLEVIKKVTKELRNVERLAFGPAYLLSTLYTFLAHTKLKLATEASIENARKEAKKILRYAVESSLSIAPLWDDELRNKVKDVLDNVLGS